MPIREGMPNYRTHDAMNLTALGMTFAGYTIAVNAGAVKGVSGAAMIGYVLAYLVGTFLVTPDLDLHGSKPKKRWGLLKVLWRPYASLVPHRSSFSHGWLIGPATRLAYLALLAIPVLSVTNALEPTGALAEHLGREALTATVLGYYASQWMHLIADRAPLRP